jgi:ketosteroid isomerase-like protein
MPHCAALICYYPSSIPNPNASYPSQLNLVLHLTTSQHFAPKFSYYTYNDVVPGFAEHDIEQYNRVATSLAWSRSLGAVRKGFKIQTDLEGVRETFAALSFGEKDAAATVGSIMQDGYVNNSPTSTGGIGQRALYHFYHDFFMPGNPPSLATKLISRTVGVDRVVDEMVVSFKHTQEIPWILPGVPPTGKAVQIAVVSIIAVRGGKLVSEHVYWDQASVLVQIGALDPSYISKALRSIGCKKLPVVGADAAKKVLDVDKVEMNQFITKW